MGNLVRMDPTTQTDKVDAANLACLAVLGRLSQIHGTITTVNKSVFRVDSSDEDMKERAGRLRAVVDKLDSVIESLSIPIDLAKYPCILTLPPPPRTVNEKKLSEELEQSLTVLDSKIEYCLQSIRCNVLSANDAWTRIELLLNITINVINGHFVKAITRVNENQETDLHVFQSTLLDKHLRSLAFLRKHSPQSVANVLKLYVQASASSHERKLAEYMGSLSAALLEEPLVSLGDYDAGHQMLSRLLEYLQDCLGSEQAFLDRLVPDPSERALAMSATSTAVLKVCERSIHGMAARCCSLKTLSACNELLAKSAGNPHLAPIVECLARATAKQSSLVIDSQALSIQRSFKSGRLDPAPQVSPVTQRLAELLQECDCPRLFAVWLEMVDRVVNKEPLHVVFAMKNLDHMQRLHPSEELQLRLDDLASRFAECELAKMDSKMLTVLNTATASPAVANMLISAFNCGFRLWLTQFHVGCLQELCEHEQLRTLCHRAFANLLVSIHAGLQTVVSFLPEDDIDTLVPLALVSEATEAQLA